MVLEQAIGIIAVIVAIFINALVLMVVAKLFKLQDQSYRLAFRIALMYGIATYVINLLRSFLAPSFSIVVMSNLIFIALAVWLIRKFHFLGWGKAAFVSIVFWLLALIVNLIIVILASFLAVII